MWLIEALKQECEMTVATTGGWNLAALNAFYGTDVRENEVRVRIAPVPLLLRGQSAAALRGACYQRFARQIAGEYDVRISAYNATDWGMFAIHFIADFSWHRDIREKLHPEALGLVHQNSMLHKAYLWIASLYGWPSGRDVLKEDVLIANSMWTASILRESCGVDCAAVVYPSVWARFPLVSWTQKETEFVMIGRIAPEKQIERAITILAAVRQRGHTVQLHLCGQIGNDLYGRQIAKLCKQYADWITAEGQISGAKKAQILTRCRFGLQTTSAESFGISIAEMAKAGTIVFAQNGGGQAEILYHSDLLFADINDAVHKISAVLSSPEKQSALRAHLKRRNVMFSAERFMKAAHTEITKTLSYLHSTKSYRPRVIIGHPRIGFGGSESTVMWLIEALKRDCNVTVMTTGGWDLAKLNGFYGTDIREDEVAVRIAPVPLLLRNLSVAALRGACYQRFAYQIAAEYDVRISAYNITDWGLPAVHFIADFSWHRRLREQLDPPSQGLIYKNSILRKAYLGLANIYANPSGRDVLREDPIIANSRWTADLIRRTCGVDCEAVVYHSTWAEFPFVAWEEKEQAFVMISRIVPEKRIEQAIAILEAVRERGHAIRLHLCGPIQNDTYGKRIIRLCRKHSDWIIAEGQVSGERKAQLLARCRFGIQTRSAEPFGISVAEMVKAGAIVFAPNDGGQAEILQRPELLFADTDDAVEKILAVLEDPSCQLTLRTLLADLSQRFNAHTFIQEARACLAGLLGQNKTYGLNAVSH